MAKYARQPIAGWRNEALVLPIRVVGLDLTGKVLRAQVRLAPGTPGSPLIDLATVSNVNAQGLSLIGVTSNGGTPTSDLMLRVNKSSMQALPAAGEVGQPTPLSYALQLAGVTRLCGSFIVLDSAIDSDDNPAGRLPAYGNAGVAMDVADGLAMTIGDDGVSVTIDGLGELAALLRSAQGFSDAAATAANASIVAKQSAETARDAARVSAQAAGVSASVAATARSAVDQAISKVPADTRLLLEAVAISVLRGVAADTPVGRLAFLSEPGREGVWQLRSGDYAARVASDTFGFRYLAMTAKPAGQQAWERIVPNAVFNATWTGIDATTANAAPALRAAAALIDPYSTLQLPAFRMPAGGATPTIVLKAGTHLRGCGDASWLDFTDPTAPHALIQAAADDVTISDLRVSLVAPNDSAGNPACIMIGAHLTGDTPRAVRRTRVRNVLCDRTSTGIIAFVHAIDGSPAKGFVRPSGIEISDARVVTNGTAVSLFGAQDVSVEGCDLTYTDALPSNAPAAKRLGIRILGTERAEIADTRISGFPGGVHLDAAYVYGQRLYNRDVTVRRSTISGAMVGFEVFECRGEARVVAPVFRRSLASADRVTFADVQTNFEVSTAPGSPTEVGDVTIVDVDAQGVSLFLQQNGSMGHLRVEGGTVVGNANGSDMDGQRGAVMCGGVAGYPGSTRIVATDFLMTGPSAAPAIVVGVAEPGDVVEIERCRLPESGTAVPIFAAGSPAFFSGGGEQRPFNGRVNLGSNRVHRVGSLAQRRDGTPLPAVSLPAPAAWTRNFLRTAETSANVFAKTGSSEAYDAAVWSTEQIVGDLELVYRLGQVTDKLLVGLDSTPGQPAVGGMDWAIEYANAGGSSSIVEYNGAQLAQALAYDATTIERWRRQGSRLIFSRGGVDLFDTAVSPMLAFAMQASFARQGDKVTILRFGTI